MPIDKGKKKKKEQIIEKVTNKLFTKQREPNQPTGIQQAMAQEDVHVQQEGSPNTVTAMQQSRLPDYPPWPTSRPGPLVITHGVGQRPVNSLRSEQMAEVGYNQTMGKPARPA